MGFMDNPGEVVLLEDSAVRTWVLWEVWEEWVDKVLVVAEVVEEAAEGVVEGVVEDVVVDVVTEVLLWAVAVIRINSVHVVRRRGKTGTELESIQMEPSGGTAVIMVKTVI
jgi:hypothetical protein